MSLKIETTKKITKTNVFTDTNTLAREGIHTATVIATKHIGKTPTKYGEKDFQMFHLQVHQFNEGGTKQETAEIHQQYHRSFHPQSSLVAFLAGFGIEASRGMTFDFDDLVGKKLNISVTHTKRANGVHVNITPLKSSGGVQ